jgi:hypothetical protein
VYGIAVGDGVQVGVGVGLGVSVGDGVAVGVGVQVGVGVGVGVCVAVGVGVKVGVPRTWEWVAGGAVPSTRTTTMPMTRLRAATVLVVIVAPAYLGDWERRPQGAGYGAHEIRSLVQSLAPLP